MTKTKKIDLNCDLGEGVNNDPEIMPLITSCNIACGGHAGSLATIAQVIALAKENRVRAGAHPSFPDKKNFGRQFLSMPISLLRESLVGQINILALECRRQEVEMHHIKPHGALYNKCAVDKTYGEMMVSLTEEYFPKAKLYVPFGSVIAEIAKNRVEVSYEIFADRNYNADHTLVSRKSENALIINEEDLLKHILFMVKEGKIRTVNGMEIPTRADTLCLHSDTPGASEMIKKINATLTEAGLLKTKL